ncbi:formimidoylglutamase [Psychroflexus sp. YR1-1]|uniref:Formimidoylglutamase n=1 Tax=Psychroflexus aurantiacus TaxID=2709310 RepID=A0A6B3R474_9FLAO|nr:formimidoylglutamase [Psychroflexus aurantiacus]NEV94828.1 formimidoylglutamase [Psychroflexus aurantiacus]
MAFEFLEPVNAELQQVIHSFSDQSLSQYVRFYEGEDEIELDNIQLAFLCVKDSRQSVYEKKSDFYFDDIRTQLYSMYVGNWEVKILDLGDIAMGDEASDTAYVFKSILSALYKKSIVPIILGGSQDLTFYQYRAYDGIRYMVNLTSADHKFDLGNSEMPMHGQSYVGKMIIEEPYNLFNYSNLGYQSFLSPLEEIDLMDKLFFEALRLGELKQDFTKVEPVLRDTDVLSVDIYCVKSSEIADSNHKNINGFSTFDLCKLSRYAGMSDKLSSFGIYELQALAKSEGLVQLISQMLWYFMEGYSLRLNEEVSEDNSHFTKYSVPIQDEVLVFLKSEVSNRWWIKIPNENNNAQKASLLACDKQDYLDATASILPERWLKAKYKNNI